MDLTGRLGDAATLDASLSKMARGVVGSEILRIAAEIRALKAKGAEICNLTVGDFDPAQFPIPAELLTGVRDALDSGQTNYPPSDGVLSLREAVARTYKRNLGLEYPVESVLITGGARPLLYGTFLTVLDPGDVVIYPVPSWNNNHYAYLTGARAIELPVTAASNFFPTADDLRPHLGSARLLMLNSPLNPTGTAISPDQLREICEAVVEENVRRTRAGARALWLCYDQVYWQLVFGGETAGKVRHVTPPEVVPEIAPYTIILDAASKSFAATGLRVGWAVMPPVVRQRMADILGHVGAWAPRAEQVAMAALLDDDAVVSGYLTQMRGRVAARLDRLARGFADMRAAGLPVDVIPPQGAIYLSVRFSLPGKTNEQIRKLLLDQAGFAIVPFQAFGLKEDSGWFRISVGAVSVEDIDAALPRVRAALARG
ncbi:MAG TPA: aminotransferase class I/II-fold pyridoxal phosphate-dependent enzyme [Polyangia bacterium]|jgi:aspartate aminotransferase